jgi:hypothetical protein
MSTASLYAKALHLAAKEGDAKAILANLRDSLERRGYVKLLPSIYREYQKVLLADERSQSRKLVTPESERTRELLELYRRLVTTPGI